MSFIDDVLQNENVMEIGKEAVDFISENRHLLQKLGKNAFTSILYLIQYGEIMEAEIRLIEQMDAWELIAKMNANAEEIEKIAQMKDEWKAFIKSCITRISMAAAGALLKILI